MKKFAFELKFEFYKENQEKNKIYQEELIFFDITSMESFESVLNNWSKMIKFGNGVLVGCKSDLYRDRKVSYEIAKELAYRYGIPYVEVSYKRPNSIDIPIAFLLKRLLKKKIFYERLKEEEYLKNLKIDHAKIKSMEDEVICNIM